MTKNRYIGPNFDDILKEEGTLEKAELAAIKKVIAEQVTKEMKKKKLSQTEMAKRLGTSRAAFMRLLNPGNYSVTLLTLYRAATALGKGLEIKFH
jgi:predicted XRE-type DNA-binding protein